MLNQNLTRDQWFSLVEEHSKSDLTQKEFCKEKDLSIVRFGYYVQRYRKNKGNDLIQSPNFSEVIVPSKTQTTTNEISIELPNGFKFHASSCIHPDNLKKILGAILSC